MELPNSTFRKLRVWQKSMIFVTQLYTQIKSFPSDETYGLSSQLKRSAVSIPSNIAEGYGRKGTNDYLRFLNIAMSSMFEVQTQLEIAYNLTYLNEEEFIKLYEDTREIERMLSSLIRKISA